MKLKKSKIGSSAGALAGLILFASCGEDPSMYQGETLTFETPVAGKLVEQNATGKKASELDLGADEASDFRFARFDGIAVGAVPWWGPYPLYDYYLEPVPVPVPVSPGFALIDYVHPFYAFPGLYSFWDDDDDGLFFRSDDE